MRIDTHAHLHPAHDPSLWLDTAWSTLVQPAPNRRGMVWLFAINQADPTAGLEAMDDQRWSIEPRPEGPCLRVTRRGDATGAELTVVPGQQVATREGLEVLALAPAGSAIASRQPLTETVEQALETAALVVLPWGVGKWLGRRGEGIREAIDRYGERIALGDNANRPAAWRRPRLLNHGETKAMAVLPGSDPLPLPGHETRVGSFGLQLDATIGEHTPLEDVLNLLRRREAVRDTFGGPCPTLRAVIDQVRLRITPPAGPSP